MKFIRNCNLNESYWLQVTHKEPGALSIMYSFTLREPLPIVELKEVLHKAIELIHKKQPFLRYVARIYRNKWAWFDTKNTSFDHHILFQSFSDVCPSVRPDFLWQVSIRQIGTTLLVTLVMHHALVDVISYILIFHCLRNYCNGDKNIKIPEEFKDLPRIGENSPQLTVEKLLIIPYLYLTGISPLKNIRLKETNFNQGNEMFRTSFDQMKKAAKRWGIPLSLLNICIQEKIISELFLRCKPKGRQVKISFHLDGRRLFKKMDMLEENSQGGNRVMVGEICLNYRNKEISLTDRIEELKEKYEASVKKIAWYCRHYYSDCPLWFAKFLSRRYFKKKNFMFLNGIFPTELHEFPTTTAWKNSSYQVIPCMNLFTGKLSKSLMTNQSEEEDLVVFLHYNLPLPYHVHLKEIFHSTLSIFLNET